MSFSSRPTRRRKSIFGRLRLFGGKQQRKPRALEELSSQTIFDKKNHRNDSSSPTSIADFPPTEIAFFETEEAGDVESLLTSSFVVPPSEQSNLSVPYPPARPSKQSTGIVTTIRPEEEEEDDNNANTAAFQPPNLGSDGSVTRHLQNNEADSTKTDDFHDNNSSVFVKPINPVLHTENKENPPKSAIDALAQIAQDVIKNKRSECATLPAVTTMFHDLGGDHDTTSASITRGSPSIPPSQQRQQQSNPPAALKIVISNLSAFQLANGDETIHHSRTNESGPTDDPSFKSDKGSPDKEQSVEQKADLSDDATFLSTKENAEERTPTVPPLKTDASDFHSANGESSDAMLFQEEAGEESIPTLPCESLAVSDEATFLSAKESDYSQSLLVPAKNILVGEYSTTRRPTFQNQTETDVMKGSQVRVVAGKHKGKKATILGMKNKITYHVKLEDGLDVGVRVASVEPVEKKSLNSGSTSNFVRGDASKVSLLKVEGALGTLDPIGIPGRRVSEFTKNESFIKEKSTLPTEGDSHPCLHVSVNEPTITVQAKNTIATTPSAENKIAWAKDRVSEDNAPSNKTTHSSKTVYKKNDRITVANSSNQHHDKHGIVRSIGEKFVMVTLDDGTKTKFLPKNLISSAQPVPEKSAAAESPRNLGAQSGENQPPVASNTTKCSPNLVYRVQDRVKVTSSRNQHCDKLGTVRSVGKQFVTVSLDDGTETKCLPKNLIFSNKPAPTEVAPAEPPIKLRTVAENMVVKSEAVASSKSVYKKGDRVTVDKSKSKHNGKNGTVTSVGKKVLMVKLDNGHNARVKPEYLNSSDIQAPEGSLIETPRATRERRVAGPLASIVKALTPRVTSSSQNNRDIDEASQRVLENFRWPGSEKGGLFFGGRRIRKIRTEKKNSKLSKDNFLSHWLGERMIVEDQSLDGDEPPQSLENERSIDGRKYELVSAKVMADDEKSGNAFGGFKIQQKCLRLVYAEVEGPNEESVNLQEKLESLGDFGTLAPRKAAARLELLQSPAWKLKPKDYAILPIQATDICIVDPEGQDGCGFVCEEFLEKLLGGTAAAKRTVAIQIRLYCPEYGIFKGMLMRKRNVIGPPIQVNETMLKVGPARHVIDGKYEGNGLLVVNKIGKHPNSTNEQVGRLLDPINSKNVTKSFTDKIKLKKLSTMYTRVWQSLGVAEEKIEKYVKESLKPEGLNHACVVGVSDPTKQLPPGSVFVTGTKNAGWMGMNEIYATRSPCVEPKDGRMIPVITSKPNDMSEDTWGWLQGLHFGAIIFANPKPEEKPLPELVAGGDLDGDLYFICWSQSILKHIKPLPITDEEKRLPPDGTETKPPRLYDPDWLKKAQKIMLDAAAHHSLGKLIGRLYTEAQRLADADKVHFMKNEDCITLARAFKRALEMGKHGGKVYLPSHLHERIPENLRSMLESEEEV